MTIKNKLFRIENRFKGKYIEGLGDFEELILMAILLALRKEKRNVCREIEGMLVPAFLSILIMRLRGKSLKDIVLSSRRSSDSKILEVSLLISATQIIRRNKRFILHTMDHPPMTAHGD